MGSVPKTRIKKDLFIERLKDDLDCRLNDPILDNWNPQRPRLPISLWDVYPSTWLGSEGFISKLPLEFLDDLLNLGLTDKSPGIFQNTSLVQVFVDIPGLAALAVIRNHCIPRLLGFIR